MVMESTKLFQNAQPWSEHIIHVDIAPFEVGLSAVVK